MLDLPIGSAIVPKEEIKKAALLKIEVSLDRYLSYAFISKNKFHSGILPIGHRRLCSAKKYSTSDKRMWFDRIKEK